jgi:hypothetical protein
MKLLLLACLSGLALAATVAYRLDAPAHSGPAGSIGPTGLGVLLGAGLGLALSALGAAWQGALLARGSRHALNVFVIAFLVKLVVVVGGTLALFHAGPPWIDWSAYLVAFPCGVVWITAFGVFSSARALRQRTA